jgi:hypothetical protein
MCDAHHSALDHHDELLCPICLDSNTCAAMALQLPCQHVFHSACMAKWNLRANTCPVCRQEFREIQTSGDPDASGMTGPGLNAGDEEDEYTDEDDVLLTEEDLMMLMLNDDGTEFSVVTDVAEDAADLADLVFPEEGRTARVDSFMMDQPASGLGSGAFYDSFANLYLGVD